MKLAYWKPIKRFTKTYFKALRRKDQLSESKDFPKSNATKGPDI